MKKQEQQVSPASANRLRRKYDRTFKQEAVRMLQSGKVVKEVAELLGVSEQVLYNWKSTVTSPAPTTRKGGIRHWGIFAPTSLRNATFLT
ncbi:MAG: transposase [Bacteroidetes Order II. Incertae sedis bacterium]|nr:transposase [Bacteroidetes Order II. bacterium]